MSSCSRGAAHSRQCQQPWHTHPCEVSALKGAVEAAELGLIAPILVGPSEKIRAAAKTAAVEIGKYQIVETQHSQASATKAVDLVRQGRAQILMKGSLHTDELMSAVVAREVGLRTGQMRCSYCHNPDTWTMSGRHSSDTGTSN
jgi:phosphotransacetylase